MSRFYDWVCKGYLVLAAGILVSPAGCGSTPSGNTPDGKQAAARAALEKHDAKLTEKDGKIVRVALGPEGNDADLALLQDLPTVEHLTADKRGVTDEGLAALKNHPGLKTLDLSISGITNAGLAHLQELPKLEEVILKRCDLTAPAYVEIAKCKTLKRIRAPQSNFDDECLAALKDCAQLELIDLQDCNRVTEKGLEVLRNFPKLKFLRLWGPTITDKVLSYVSEAKALRTLSLEATPVGPEGLAQVKGLTNLQELKLSSAANITSASLEQIAGHSHLQVLELRNTAVGSKGMVHLAGLKELRVLDLSETAVGDKGLASLKGLTNLEDLNLWQSTTSDAGLENIAGMTKLKRLNLDKCKVTDAGIAHLQGLQDLEFLHLGSTSVGDPGLEGLHGLKKLNKLEITFLPGVTDEGVRKLKEALPGLKEIIR